ncbi:hypothetical protein PFMALIP_04546 [Plasmodium falciparum MaliPS096_E11]|uniref:Uncharacterized protein n=1 Tax=Plasmodium falciparum MaliPS096_E11 TaxID=1036727 RepID=A0A024WJM7_PLAFA|nr:hypothetical protein PFMALIP_04546 [Plasmodium falciparum MaliPS096_E11]
MSFLRQLYQSLA